jgi:dCTP deaminase
VSACLRICVSVCLCVCVSTCTLIPPAGIPVCLNRLLTTCNISLSLPLSPNSYDVNLGPYFFRESQPEAGMGIYNPYSRTMVQRVWGKVQEAERAGDWMDRTGIPLENISADDRIIWIAPGETILGHTQQFIGGRKSVTTMMKARSSMGRNFIECCKCAGWGDANYVNRWTMEITNNSRHYNMPLVVGRRIAQIIFFDTDGTLNDRGYNDSGKYQTSGDLDEIMSTWSPSDMLPRMYLDREIFQTGNAGSSSRNQVATDDE